MTESSEIICSFYHILLLNCIENDTFRYRIERKKKPNGSMCIWDRCNEWLLEMVFTNLNSGYVFDGIVYECMHIMYQNLPKQDATCSVRMEKTIVYMMVEHVEKEAFKCFKLMLDSDSIKLN